MKKIVLIFALVVVAFTSQAQLVTGRTRTTINQPRTEQLEKQDKKNRFLLDLGIGYEYYYDRSVAINTAIGWRRMMAKHHYWDVAKLGYQTNFCCMNYLKLTTGYHFNYKLFYAGAGIGAGYEFGYQTAAFVYELGVGIRPLDWLTIGLKWDGYVLGDHPFQKEGDTHAGVIGINFGLGF